jgi:hypothetical protein
MNPYGRVKMSDCGVIVLVIPTKEFAVGMFDDLTCEMPLPDGKPAIPFQTKDLDCELNQYTITPDGRLARNDGRGEPNEWNDFTGTLRFYGYEGDPNEIEDFSTVWREYEATVEKGQVMKLKVVPYVRHR